MSLTEFQHILIRDDSRCDRTDIGQYDGFGDVVTFEVFGELLWNDQFFVAFVKLGFLVVVNPVVPVLFEPDVDVEVDGVHGNRIPDFSKKENAQRREMIMTAAY